MIPIDGLLRLGLTSYEAKCYLALLGKSELTAAEVAKIAGIPRSKVYETLEKLLHKGLCHYIPDAVVKYRASDPDVLNENVEEKLSKIKERIDQTEAEYNETFQLKDGLIAELSDIYRGGQDNTDPLNFIEVIKDLDQINRRYIQILDETKTELQTLTKSQMKLKLKKPPQYFKSGRQLLEKQRLTLLNALKRGVVIRSIYELSPNEEENWISFERLDSVVEAGHKAKVLPDVPFQMSIFDTKTILFNLADPVSGIISNTTQIIIHQALARGQKMLFEMLWSKGEDYCDFKKRLNIK